MWTVLWKDGEKDRWDRFETEDEVWELLDKLTENPDVCAGEAWIIPPAANDLALTPNLK